MEQSRPRQVWIVTGASRGLGRATVEAALEAGHCVLGTARDPAAAAVVQDERLLLQTLDVTAPAAAHEAVVSAAVEAFGRVDVLVNNAGYGLLSTFEETSEHQVEAVFETNVFGL